MAEEKPAPPPSKHKHAMLAFVFILLGIFVVGGSLTGYSLCAMLTSSTMCATYRVDLIVGAVLILVSILLGKMRERKK